MVEVPYTLANPCTSLEGKTIAAQTPEIAVAGSGGLFADQELMGSMETAVRMALSGMLVLGDRDAGASGSGNV
jgi:hypothetical protein